MTTPPRAPRWSGWVRCQRGPWVEVLACRLPTYEAAWQQLFNVVRTSADLLVTRLGVDPNKKGEP